MNYVHTVYIDTGMYSNVHVIYTCTVVYYNVLVFSPMTIHFFPSSGSVRGKHVIEVISS